MTKPAALLACLVLASVRVSSFAQAPRPPTNIVAPAAPAASAHSDVATAAPGIAPAAPAPEPSRRVVVADDGSVLTTMPNGSRRITRPGVCGYTIVSPGGARNTISCIQVPRANPPLPDATTGDWLNAHSDGLLDVARALLGNDQTSIDNYLRNHENPEQSVYDRIRLRTSLLSDLSRTD